jgi:hypothetical protein
LIVPDKGLNVQVLVNALGPYVHQFEKPFLFPTQATSAALALTEISFNGRYVRQLGDLF